MNTRNVSGFTLIESILSLVLLGMIAMGIFSFLSMGVDAFYFSTENTEAASRIKPTYDFVSTRLSDMTEICCFSNSRIEFYNSDDGFTCADDNPPARQVLLIDNSSALIITSCTGDVNNRTCSSWTILEDLENAQMSLSTQSVTVRGTAGTYVELIDLDFKYKSDRPGSVLDKDFSLSFSPRNLVPSSVPGC